MVKPIPDGYHTATPYLIVHDAASAIDWYVRALTVDIPGAPIIVDTAVRMGVHGLSGGIAILPGTLIATKASLLPALTSASCPRT